MAIPLTIYGTADLTYSYQQAARFRSPWLFDPSNAWQSEPNAWEVILTDADLASIRQQRNQSVVRPWRVVPSRHAGLKNIAKSLTDNSKRIAAICHEGLSSIDRFDAARFTLADAFFLGRRYAQIQWMAQTISLDGTPPLMWYVPFKLVDVDRRRFRWVPEWSYGINAQVNAPTVTTNVGSLATTLANPPTGSQMTGVHLELFSTGSWQWQKLPLDERRQYVEYVWDDTEDRIGHGRGALECFFFTHYWTAQIVKKAMEGIDRFANGTVDVTLDDLRAASTDQQNAALITSTQTAVQKMRSEHVFIHGKGDKYAIIEATGSMLQIAIDFRNQLLQGAMRYATGSVRPMGMGKETNSGRASTEAEADTSEAYYQFPRQDLDDTLDRELLGSFIYFNAANFATLGLDTETWSNVKRPKFTSEQIRRQDPATRLATLLQLNQVLPVLTSELYEAAEATPVAEGDDACEAGAGQKLTASFEADNMEKNKRARQDKRDGGKTKSSFAADPDSVEDFAIRPKAPQVQSPPQPITVEFKPVIDVQPAPVIINPVPAPLVTVETKPPIIQNIIETKTPVVQIETTPPVIQNIIETKPPVVQNIVETPQVLVTNQITAVPGEVKITQPAPVVNVTVPEAKPKTKDVQMVRQPDGSIKGEIKERS